MAGLDEGLDGIDDPIGRAESRPSGAPSILAISHEELGACSAITGFQGAMNWAKLFCIFRTNLT